MEKTGGNKMLRIAISIFLAVVLWFYVSRTANPEVVEYLRSIPVTFTGVEALEARGFLITEGAEQTVSLQVRAKRDVMDRLSSSTVTATVDVSAISQAGDYSETYQVFPSLSGMSSFSSFTVTDYQPATVSFTVGKLKVRTIPVQGSFAGSVAEGYQTGAFSFSPEGIEVRGEESIVNQIDKALVTLDIQDISETYSGESPYTLISFDGESIPTDNLEVNAALVRTTLPVVQLKEVPLVVTLIPGGGATNTNTTANIEPKSIMVSGSPKDLESLKEITLADIDLAQVLDGDIVTRPIELSAELTNESGISEAKVTISMQGLSTAVLEVSNIEFSNVDVPEGYVPVPVTQSRQVTIRGPMNAVASITPSQLKIVADLSQIGTATGTQTVPVKVHLAGRNDVGVIGEYSISVSIVREEDLEATPSPTPPPTLTPVPVPTPTLAPAPAPVSIPTSSALLVARR